MSRVLLQFPEHSGLSDLDWRVRRALFSDTCREILRDNEGITLAVAWGGDSGGLSGTGLRVETDQVSRFLVGESASEVVSEGCGRDSLFVSEDVGAASVETKGGVHEGKVSELDARDCGTQRHHDSTSEVKLGSGSDRCDSRDDDDKERRLNSSELGVGEAGKRPGRWAASNRRKKQSKRAKALRDSVPDWRRSAAPPTGFCETVVSQQAVSPASSCPSYGQALSDAEREARDTLAQRRAAENKVAKKLAEMKLASLEDEKKCKEYADLKKSRIIQWTNEATAKSQQSLEKCKSIDPSSSASQQEIRDQAKQNEDMKAEIYRMTMAIRTNCSDWKEILESCRPVQDSMDTELIEEMAEFGLAGNDEPSRPTSPDMFDAIIARKNAAVREKLAKVDMKARLAAEEARKGDALFL